MINIKMFTSDIFISKLYYYLEQADIIYANRTKDINNYGKDCQYDIFADKNIKHNICKLLKNLPIVYSYNDIRYECIFSKKNKNKYACHPDTYTHYFYGVKYQILANHELFNGLNEKQCKNIITCYCFKLWCEIDNLFMNKNYENYSPIDCNTIINLVAEIYNEIYTKNYTVIGIGSNTKFEMDITYNKNNKGCIKDEVKISKQELIDLISSYKNNNSGNRPTANQLSEFYNNNIECDYDNMESIEKYLNLQLSPQLIRYYINKYELRDEIILRNR